MYSNEMSPADIKAVLGNGAGAGDGFGGWGGGWWPLIFLAMMWGGFGGMGGGGFMPWMMMSGMGQNGSDHTDSVVQRGFDQAAVTGAIGNVANAVNNGFANTATQLCSGFAGVNAGVANGFAQAEIAANARQIANMQQGFAAQTAVTDGLYGLGSQLASCCCENRLATANLGNTIIAENCADRAALSDGIRDVIANNTGNTNTLLNTINGGIQAIKDQLCQDKIDAKDETIAGLRTQLNMATLAASQAAQTQQIENYIRPPINPSYNVPNPYACYFGGNNGYGCGCAG